MKRPAMLAAAALSLVGLKDAAAKGKKKGSGKCRCKARQVCRCPRCPIDIIG
jgi:hypothetical protein